jgi:hypothetical protein
MTTYRIPVKKDRISRLSDPTGQGHDTIHAYVKIADLPLNLPSDVNPRAQNTESRVARQIQKGLLDDASVFHLLNRGLTVTAYDAEYDTQKQELKLALSSGHYGLVDGGHTYAVIRKNLAAQAANGAEAKTGKKTPEEATPEEGKEEEQERPEFLDNGYVRLEVMVGVKNELLVDVARSRNTSAQVRDESLANLEGSFDWLKEVLAKTPFGAEIAYKENEDDTQYPIDVREIIALLTLFHPNFQDSEKPPIMGYTSKGRCLELFRDQPEGFQQLKPIIPDILKLYDYVHFKFADLYKDIGGFTGIGEETKKTQRGLKLAKVTGVKAIKEGFPLYYLGEKAYYAFPDGWLLPVLSSLRAVVSYRGAAKWKANPFKFFDATGKSLVSSTLETSLSMGRNPNAVGKNRPHWIQLHAHELNQYLKMLNVDTEQEVTLK